MPTYDYRCPNGHDFERFFRKISDASQELTCPVCGATAVRRVSGGAGLLFKGSGFYLTDYGKNAHRKGGAESSSSSGESKSDGGSSGSDSGKSAGASSPASKSDTSASTKSESKSSEGTSSSKSKGGDTK